MKDFFLVGMSKTVLLFVCKGIFCFFGQWHWKWPFSEDHQLQGWRLQDQNQMNLSYTITWGFVCMFWWKEPHTITEITCQYHPERFSNPKLQIGMPTEDLQEQPSSSLPKRKRVESQACWLKTWEGKISVVNSRSTIMLVVQFKQFNRYVSYKQKKQTNKWTKTLN